MHPTGLTRRRLLAGALAGIAMPAVINRPAAAAESLEAVVARTMIIGFGGDRVDAPPFRDLLALMAHRPVGGVIYMRRNLRSDGDVTAMNQAMRETAREPISISVDEEGGAVRRLRPLRSVPATPSARDLGRTPPEISYQTYAALAEALARLGFNLNYGPVVDLAFNASNPVITRPGRSYGSDPQAVVAHAARFVAAHHAHGVASVAKHFPGHGSVSRDPHDEPVDASGTWRGDELDPFRRLIEAQAPAMVMTSHQIIAREPFCSESPHPITFCPNAARYLRRELRFGGPIISDDLTMGAITSRYGLDTAVMHAVRAGHDAVILANLGSDPMARIEAVIRHVAGWLRDDLDAVMRFSDAGERLLAQKRAA